MHPAERVTQGRHPRGFARRHKRPLFPWRFSSKKEFVAPRYLIGHTLGAQLPGSGYWREVQAQRIEHFGFFREHFQTTLWQQRSLALLQGLQVPTETAA